jgi:hypothetical protein
MNAPVVFAPRAAARRIPRTGCLTSADDPSARRIEPIRLRGRRFTLPRRLPHNPPQRHGPRPLLAGRPPGSLTVRPGINLGPFRPGRFVSQQGRNAAGFGG